MKFHQFYFELFHQFYFTLFTGDTENVNLCGIKVAYRREIRRYDSEETEKIKEIFKAKYPTAYDAYKMGFEVLYPDSEYHGVYKIYIPDVQ